MLTGLITLLITDAMLFLIIQLAGTLFTKGKREFPLHYAVLLLVFCIVAHYAATSVMAEAIESDRDRWLTLAATFACGIIPIGAYVRTVFHHPTLARTVKREDALTEARKLEADGNVKDSLRAYCTFLDVNPENQGAWFEAAHMLVQNGEFVLARNMLVKMRERFSEDKQAAAKIQELWRNLPGPATTRDLASRTTAHDLDAALRELIALRNAGVVTEQEYQRRKEELFEG
jgi:hypothetical protein